MERGYRARSAENVVRELVYLASLGITTIDFEDDLFTGRKTRCLEICRMIGEAGLKLDLKVRSHVRKVDEGLLQAMKGIGVKAVVFGIESGSGTMLKAMNKKATVEDNYRAVSLTKQAGLMCYADLFLGYPGETPETIAETREFLLKARPTAVNFGVLMPYPCTTVYQQAKDAGTLVSDWWPDAPVPFVRLPWASDRRCCGTTGTRSSARSTRPPRWPCPCCGTRGSRSDPASGVARSSSSSASSGLTRHREPPVAGKGSFRDAPGRFLSAARLRPGHRRGRAGQGLARAPRGRRRGVLRLGPPLEVYRRLRRPSKTGGRAWARHGHGVSASRAVSAANPVGGD